MLSLWKLRVGAEAYYLGQVAKGLDDYYTGAGEADGRWLGVGAELLGLADAVTGDDLRAILAGLVPGTGLSPNGTQIRTWKGRIPGFDLTFSAPKSVSILYAFGDPIVRSHVTDAIDAAVRDALGWLEREACFVRRGSNNRNAKTAPFEQFGTRRLPGAGFIAAGFDHRTSRAGDPQLHTHVLVANLTRGPDGRWSALDGQPLYRSKIAAGTIFQTALRNELSQRLGVGWLPTNNGVADIAGIPRRVLTHFSKRRNEIETELERTGRSGPAAAADATLATRTTKLDIDNDTLDQAWIDDAATIDYGPDDINGLLRSLRPQSPTDALAPAARIAVRRVDPISKHARIEHVSVDEFASLVAHHLPERNACITRHEIQNAVAEHLTSHADTPLLERLTDAVLASDELVPLPNPEPGDAGWEQQWTTRRLLAIEAELTHLFQPEPHESRRLDPAFVDTVLTDIGTTLGPDQADTVRRVTTQGHAVEVVVGRAGTGKTYAMRTVRHVHERAGNRLVGVCPTARAARELADGAGIESFTVPRFLNHAQLDASTVVVIDEAGMCGTVDLHRIVTRARLAGAQVVMVGDHHQLPEIAAGGGFRAALDAIGPGRSELVINRRQRHEWEHHALDHLRNGNLTTFWDTYNQHNRVVTSDDIEALHERALDDWWTNHGAGSDAHLIAGTRAEARLLNRLARQRATEAGHLTGPALEVRSRQFQVGDRVVLLKNMPGQLDLTTGRRCRVDNGTIGTITHIGHDDSTIDIALKSERRIRLTTDYVTGGHVDHGYATTIHKAQGLTCDHIHVVGPAGLYREAGYVALSRARHSAHLYATTRDAATIGERTHTTGIPLPSENTNDPDHDLRTAVEHSNAKHFALTTSPCLDAAADLATSHDLAELEARRRHITETTRQLVASGLVDPSTATERLHLAATHRSKMHVGGRVNALDWDNVGEITRLHDSTGQATIRFTSATGHTTTRTLPWEQTKPIDHPEPAELTDLAERFFHELTDQVDLDTTIWNDALADHDIEPDAPRLVTEAVEQRRHKVFHQLRATPPHWLTWWTGERPTDPTAATVYDDHIRTVATWRDEQRVADEYPGFGPMPADPAIADQWRTHMDNALAIRNWLAQHTNEPTAPPTISIADARHRLTELDDLFATAPADQRLIIDELIASPHIDIADKIDALQLAGAQQSQRRDWILEHWPHVIEHHELTAIVDAAGPLAHWPTALPARAIELIEELRRTIVDTPEARTIAELEEAVAQSTPEGLIRSLRDELKPIRRQIAQFDRLQEDHPDRTTLAKSHVERLRERAQDLEAEIAHAETQATLGRWRQRPDSDLQVDVERRTNHLVHNAIESGHPAVAHTACAVLAVDPEANVFDLHHALAAELTGTERPPHHSVRVERLGPANLPSGFEGDIDL